MNTLIGSASSEPVSVEAWLPLIWQLRQLRQGHDVSCRNVHIAYRSAGRLRARHHVNAVSIAVAIDRSLASLVSETTAAVRTKIDLVEIGTCDEFNEPAPLPIDRCPNFLANANRGVFGYELSVEGDKDAVKLIFPQEVVSTNRPPRKWVSQFSDAGSVSVRTFSGRQWLIERQGTADPVWMSQSDRESGCTVTRCFRGSPLVPDNCVARTVLARLEDLLSNYLLTNVQADGRMCYLRYPSQGREDTTRNNSIRQWMATLALARIARRRGSSQPREILDRNVAYNLRQMFSREGDKGLIHDGDRVKLGAVALAWLALQEADASGQYESERAALAFTISALWRPDGRFRTFERPAERDDQWNFYPGEALLAWSAMYARTRDQGLLDRLMTAFRFYCDWHRENRNPAFVPWHTQAYVNVWRETRAPELLDFVFEMNDWLLPVQQWESAPHPDCRGRFYDPRRPFGPPHASSTGVYLEGLVEAFAAARDIGDQDRAARYRIAIRRGLRSIAQLAFKDDTDLFYVSKRVSLRGGVRTCEYDNTVRVDNVQHPLMAIQRALDCGVFGESD